MTQSAESELYVQVVLRLYLELPDTPLRARPHDRRLAQELNNRGIPLALIEASLLLATARRNARPPTATPLGPVRSLSYFLPVIEELHRRPLPRGYLDYLRSTHRTGDRPEIDAFS
jgi:hypothetical protein